MALEGREDAERLAVVESQLKNIRDAIFTMNAKLDTWNATFPTRGEVKEMLVSRDQRLDRIEHEQDEMRQERQSNKNVWPTWIAVIIAAAAFLASVWPHN